MTPATNSASNDASPARGARKNGKVERFHRTLLDEWAYYQPCPSETARQQAFPGWLDWYNYHRPHTGIGGCTPASHGTGRHI